MIPTANNAAGLAPPTGFNNIDERFAFTSQHAGGVNFVFCDGSVQFIANTVESDTGTISYGFPARNVNVVLNNLYRPDDGNVIRPY
jgi:prepilin-type processing-associated H-X9-DG protein